MRHDLPRRDPSVEAWRARVHLAALALRPRRWHGKPQHRGRHPRTRPWPGVRGDRQQPERVPEPTQGHVCDSELGILFPEATLGPPSLPSCSTCSAMTTTGTEPRPMISGTRRTRTRLPQQRLARCPAPGKARGDQHVVPRPFDCRTHALSADRELAVTFVATPSRGPASSRCRCMQGEEGGMCASLSAGTERSARSSGGRSACPSRLSEEAAYRARPPNSRAAEALLGGVRGRLTRLAPCDAVAGHRFAGWAGPAGRGAASSGSTAIGL